MIDFLDSWTGLVTGNHIWYCRMMGTDENHKITYYVVGRIVSAGKLVFHTRITTKANSVEHLLDIYTLHNSEKRKEKLTEISLKLWGSPERPT